MALIFREGHMLLVSLFSIIKEKGPRIILVTYCSSELFMKTSHMMTGGLSIGGRYQHVAAREYPSLRPLYKELSMKNMSRKLKNALKRSIPTVKS